MKGYPRWFYPHSAPHRPFKPQQPSKTVVVPDSKENITYSSLNLGELVEKYGTEGRIEVEQDWSGCYYDGDEPSIAVFVVSAKEIENPNYETELETYKKNLASYNKSYEKWKANKTEWAKLKKKYDEEQAEKKKAAELKQLAALKAKYEES